MAFDEDRWEILGSEIHFYSSVIGIPICIYLFILLLQLCFSKKYQRKKRERQRNNYYHSHQQELVSSVANTLNIELTQSKSIQSHLQLHHHLDAVNNNKNKDRSSEIKIAPSLMVNNDNHSESKDTMTKNTIDTNNDQDDIELIPGIPSKYCRCFTLLYCDIGEYILISLGIINIIFTVCKFTAVIIRQFPVKTLNEEHCLIKLVHFCNQSKNIATMSFFLFMLYRIRIVFRSPQSVTLSKKYYIAYLVSIQINFLLKTISAAFNGYKYKILSDNDLCIYYSTKIGQQISNISFWFDSILLLLFITHFLKRCLLLSDQNRNINIFKIRVAILGLLASISSFSISSLAFTVFGNKYFIPIDMIIKTICLSATYKLKYGFGIINYCKYGLYYKQSKIGIGELDNVSMKYLDDVMKIHSNENTFQSIDVDENEETKYSKDDEIFWSQYMDLQNKDKI